MISRGATLPVMVVIMLLGFALGAVQLNADILWVDEMASVSAMGAEDPPYDVVRIVRSIVAHDPYSVPLYSIVGAGWARLTGWSQVPLRYLSLLFGVLSIAWLFRLASDMFNRRAALVAAFLFATNAFVIIYFHEVRFYTLWLLLSLAHVWHYWRLATGAKASIASWIVFAATTSALLYTHPFSIFVLLGLGAHHILLAPKDRRWFSVAIAWAAGLLTFLPYEPLLAIGFREAAEAGVVQSKAATTLELIPMLANVFANGVDALWIAVFALGGWAIWRNRSGQILPLLLIAVTILAALFVFHEFFPFLSSRRLRYFLVVLALALAMFAHILTSASRWPVVVSAVALVWLIGGYHIYRQAEQWTYAAHRSLLVPHPPLHRFTDALQFKARPQDAILGFIESDLWNNGLRFGFSTVEYYSRAVLGIHDAFIWTELTGDELRREFDQRVDDHPYLLFTYEPGNLAGNFAEVKTLLEQDYVACKILVGSDEIFSQRYALRALGCDRGYQEIHYDNGIKIIDRFAAYDDEAKSLRVVTGWEVADKSQLEQYNVSVQIITPDWQKALQAPDRHLYDNILTWYAVEISTEDLPPGDYSAMVILYDRYTVKKVPGVDTMTGQASDIFAVMSFTVDA